jgi:hypothetical protein
MGQKTIIRAVAALFGAGLAVVLLASNATRRAGEARFSPGQNGLNELHVRGPSGMRCITYSVAPGPGGVPTLSSSGSSSLPFFGDSVDASTYYPSSGEVLAIPPEQHVRLSAAIAPGGAIEAPRPGTDEHYGTFIILTRDPTWMQRLATEAPALQWKPAAPAPPATR